MRRYDWLGLLIFILGTQCIASGAALLYLYSPDPPLVAPDGINPLNPARAHAPLGDFLPAGTLVFYTGAVIPQGHNPNASAPLVPQTLMEAPGFFSEYTSCCASDE